VAGFPPPAPDPEAGSPSPSSGPPEARDSWLKRWTDLFRLDFLEEDLARGLRHFALGLPKHFVLDFPKSTDKIIRYD